MIHFFIFQVWFYPYFTVFSPQGLLYLQNLYLERITVFMNQSHIRPASDSVQVDARILRGSMAEYIVVCALSTDSSLTALAAQLTAMSSVEDSVTPLTLQVISCS